MSTPPVDDGESLSLLAAEAFAALERAQRHAHALAHALDQAQNALTAAGLRGLDDQVRKIIEFHRLATARIDVMTRRVAEGGY